MISCRDVAEFLADYIERSLPWGQRLRFRLHLLLCRDCRRYLDSYRKTTHVARSLGTEPHADDCGCGNAAVPESLVRAILASRRAADGARMSPDGTAAADDGGVPGAPSAH